MDSRGVRLRKIFAALGIVAVGFGLVDLVSSGRAHNATHAWAVDLDINWVAANRLVDREPLYDRAAARAEGAEEIGPTMLRTGTGTFSSYIGTPATALAHAPFLVFDLDAATALFRLLAALGMIGALVLAAWALAPPARWAAALLGVGALFLGFPFVKTIALGQGNELVMLGIAVGIWAATRDRWRLAGVGFGVATVLKISPVLLVVYLVLRGRRQVLLPAIATAVGWTALAAVVGRPGDLWVWARDVAPHVSPGTVSIYNQSLVGWISRIFTSGTDLSVNASPGAVSWLAYAFAATVVVALWRTRRARPLEPLELGIVVLVAVLAGPLSWDHYATWALIPLVLILDVTRWARLRRVPIIVLTVALGISLVLLHGAILVPSPASVAADWSLRVGSGPYTIALLIWLGVGWWLLARAPAADPASPPGPYEAATVPAPVARDDQAIAVGEPA